MDGPPPRPRWSSEASGKPSASGKGSKRAHSPKSEDFSLFLRVYVSQHRSKSVLWPPVDPGPGAAPMMNSGSRSSSPSKGTDEGKVSCAGVLSCN